MNGREWALILYTVLAQMSVGSFVVLGIVHYFAQRSAGEQEADRLSDRALLAIGPVLVLGILASLLHLGNPLSAYRAVFNLGSSWLSREILLTVLFSVVGAVFALMQWRKMGSSGLRSVVAGVAALLGLGLVYAMSNVYLLPAQPAWNMLATPVQFYVTTFLLGALAMGTAFVVNYGMVTKGNPSCSDAQCSLLRGALRWIALVSVVLLGVEFLTVPLQVAYLSQGSPAAAATASLLVGSFNVVFVLRLLFVFVGAGLFGAVLYQNASSVGKERVAGRAAYVAFALVLVAEVLGRYLFYATHIKIGI